MHGIVIIRYSLIASMPSGVRVQCMFFDCFQKFMNYYELRRSVANNCNMCSEWNALRWIKNLGFSWKREKKKYAFFPFRLGFTFKKERTTGAFINLCKYPLRNKYHMDVLIFKQKCYLIMSEISIHLQEKKNSTHFCCCCKIPYHSDGMIQSWVHSVYYDVCLGIYCNY